jgi:hypothetical protein
VLTVAKQRPLSKSVAIGLAVAIVAALVLVAAWGMGLLGSGLFGLGRTTGPSTYSVAFDESGLPSGTTWTVTLGGRTSQTQAPDPIAFSVPEGTYPYLVGSVPSYTNQPSNGSVAVADGPAALEVNFTGTGPANGTVLGIQHVVLIMLENDDLNVILSYAPYLDYLWNTYGHATQFYPVCHGSYPDYVSVTNGRYYVCGGTIPVEDTSNLPDVLQSAGLTWGGYMESMPTPCDLTWDGRIYDPSHNPFLVSHDIVNDSSRCDSHVVNSAAFNESVVNGSLPSFSWYSPNTVDDGEYSNLTAANDWLQSFLTPILNSTNPAVELMMEHTAIFVVYDEALNYGGYSVGGIVNGYCENETGTPLTVCGGQTYLTVISPYSHGTVYTPECTDYSIESTIEWLFGVGSDGGYDGTANFPPMSGLFTTPPT